MVDSDEEIPSKRESHYNQQRSSYRSSLQSQKSATNAPSRSRASSRHHHVDEFDLDVDRRLRNDRADSETLPSPPASDASPAPNVPFSRTRGNSDARRKAGSRGQSGRGRSANGQDDGKRLEDFLAADAWMRANQPGAKHQNDIALDHLSDPGHREPRKRESGSNPPSRQRTRTPRSRHGAYLPDGHMGGGEETSQVDLTALPTISNGPGKHEDSADGYLRTRPTPKAQRTSRLATELYTISYLVFFAIWGTLARLGLQALTFYPGAPVIFSELWANVAGTFVMGFLTEDRRLFQSEWGGEKPTEPTDEPTQEQYQKEKARHGKIKKTIPMYIGLATGFCGSFTSFSSFMRDVFLSLSNDLPSPIAPARVPRNAGYSVMAVLATVFLTVSTCYVALHMGAHLALAMDRFTPSFPFRATRRIVDPLFVFLGSGTWLGAVVMAAVPPSNAWRGQALFACVFAPLGCLARYYVSQWLNPILASFPLGTFTVNIFGTAVLGMAYDLQRVSLLATGIAGGSIVGCQVLQGIEDGFCGCLTTVSTWIVELDAAKTWNKAYVYGTASVVGGVTLLVIIMGSVRWTVGWEAVACAT